MRPALLWVHLFIRFETDYARKHFNQELKSIRNKKKKPHLQHNVNFTEKEATCSSRGSRAHLPWLCMSETLPGSWWHHRHQLDLLLCVFPQTTPLDQAGWNFHPTSHPSTLWPSWLWSRHAAEPAVHSSTWGGGKWRECRLTTQAFSNGKIATQRKNYINSEIKAEN